MLVGVSPSGQVVRLVALRHVVPVAVLVARRHVDRADVLGARLPFAAIDHQHSAPTRSTRPLRPLPFRRACPEPYLLQHLLNGRSERLPFTKCRCMYF